MFDAGAIESRLTIDTSQFSRDLDAAEARVRKFESERHEVKLSAVFDSSSLSRARQQFAALDNQISKDAMARLRSNPQGSVLGALNALFSPHPVTGAPSATQAAQQGLLGKVISAPGGGGISGPLDSRTQTSAASRVLGTATPSSGTVTERVNVVGGPKDTTTTDRVNVVGAPKDNSITTTDRVNTVGLPTSGGTITTQDRVNVTGLPTTGGTITTEDKIEPQVDEASLKAKAAQAGKDAADSVSDSMTKESKSKGSGWFSGFLSGIPSMIGNLFSGAGGGGGGGGTPKDKTGAPGDNGSFAGNLVNAIGPGILGTSFKTASIAGLVGAGVGGVPALVAGTAPLALGAAGAGIVALGAKQLIGSKNTKADPNAEGPLFAQAQAAGKALQDMVQTAAAGLVTPLKNLFAEVPALAKQVTPALTQVFSGAASLIQPVITGLVSAIKAIGPGLSAAFKATGPLLQPLITGVGQLVGGLLPGLVSLLHAAAPAVSVVSGFFASLGSNLGTMFRQFSTVIGPSSTILKALLDVVTGLLPVIGGLAQAMAGALGPAFTAFAGTIRALEPFLVTIGKILAQFAGAVLTDLSGGLQLVANILKAVAPAFNQLSTALGQVFNTLESKGGFAQLGNTLESLATPIGNLITKLIDGLAPAIPPILTLFSDFVNIASTVATSVLTSLLPPLTNLAQIALGALMRVLPMVIPPLTQFISVFTADAAQVISQVGAALLNLAAVTLTKLLQAAAPLVPVLISVLNAFTPLLNVLTPVLAGTITAIANALAAVVKAIPPEVITAAAVAVGTVVGAMKLWGVATTAVATGLKAITGLSIVSWAAGAVAGFKDFQAAAEGATTAEKALVAGELALDALGPGALIGLAAAVAALGAALVITNAQAQTVVGEFAAQQQQLGYNISGYQKLAATIDQASAGYEKFAQRSTDAVRGGAAGAQVLSQQLSAQSRQVLQAAQNMESRLTSLSQNLGVSKTTIEQWASAAGISAVKFSSAGENVGQLTQQIVGFVNKNAEAVTSTASLGTNIAIFGNDVFSATTQLDAFNAIWNTLVGNLLTKQQAVTQGQQSFDNLKQSIANSGAASTQSQQSFQAYIQQIQGSLDALQKGGASVSDLNSYLQTQIDHLTSLGPLNKGEQQDLDNLRAFQDALANSTNGLNAQQKTLISQFENSLIPDLQKLGADTPSVNTAISNLANSIIQTGNGSASTAADRAALIQDLKNAGLSASDAKAFVDNLQKSIDALKGKVVTVTVMGNDSGTLTASGTVMTPNGPINAATGYLEFHAAGGLIKGGTPGKDSVLGMLMPGELVVPAHMVAGGAVDHLRGKLPGFASGGLVADAADRATTWAQGEGASWGTKNQLGWAQMLAKALTAARQAEANKEAAAAAAAVPSVATAGSAGGIVATMMKNMAAARGWTGAEWNALYALEMAEAGFNITATNPTSGAYGLAQFINGPSEYATYGGNSTTAQGQITGMLAYIAQRYGDPIAAEAHEQAYHWYGNGGMVSEPVLGYGMHSGDRYVFGERGSEMVTPIGRGGSTSMDDLASKLDEFNANMRRLIDVTSKVPAGVGAHVGGALNGAASDASFRSRYPRSSP